MRFVFLISCAAVLLMAAEPVWKKPIASWSEEDARRILSNSPWAKTVIAGVVPVGGEDARREGGNMGQPHGVGYDGLDDKKARPGLPQNIFSGNSTPRPADTRAIRLTIRWQSALPIRAAEFKARENEPPTASEEGYIIAVYDVPGAYFGDPKTLGNPLKNLAALKREGKKDVKPSAVEVFQLEHGAVVVYSFPRSADISKEDGVVEFNALIGRLQVSQSFNIAEMQFQEKLQL